MIPFRFTKKYTKITKINDKLYYLKKYNDYEDGKNMPDIVETYGKNAGKVWKTLETSGPCDATTIIKNTGLTPEDFYVAVGWLARENKVFFNENTYELKPANYESYIGENAGKVWHILNTCNELDATYIPKLAGVTEKDAFYAIGWLAKEGKISATKIRPKKVQTRFRLK